MEHVDPSSRAGPSRKRPLSRASTTSVHSVTTQQNTDHSVLGSAHEILPGQWPVSGVHGQVKHMTPVSHELQPHHDLSLMQATSQLQHPATDYSMESSVGSMVHTIQYHNHSLPNASFTDADSQVMGDDDEGDSAIVTGTKSGARASANNELEMRNLYVSNKHRELADVAQELHGNERGPHSERARQVFAMLWISKVCSKGKGSVPRGRVYASYASRCAVEKVTVLNPASFGKLVRVLFPGLKTRRLGVRGESKYHYVNFAIVDDGTEYMGQDRQHPTPAPRPLLPEPSQSLPYILPANSQYQQSRTTATAAASQTYAQPMHSPRPAIPHIHHTQAHSHSLYHDPLPSHIDLLESSKTKTRLGLCFLAESDDPYCPEGMGLPAIDPFLPPGTDADAAKALTALYLSHCTSLVECIRYCKEKMFFHLYMSFQGTLTLPVQRLFAHPSIAPWIEQCDCVVYQRMMRIISCLTLQVLPHPVMETLQTIASRLVSHVRQSFQGLPQHVVDAKEAPATLFAGLVDRVLRVNLTAHAAANLITNPANRTQMYTDWIQNIHPRKLAQVVPTRGMDDVVKLLIDQIRYLVDPAEVPWETEAMTIYGSISSLQQSHVPEGEEGGGGILERWANLLQELPARFPYASHADIVYCVERVGTAAMRELTLSQSPSFGSWWVTKTWLDEMTWFLAEKGAFLKLKSIRPTPIPTRVSTPATNASVVKADHAAEATVVRQWSRIPSGGNEQPGSMNSVPGLIRAQPDRAPFPSTVCVPPPANVSMSESLSMVDSSHDDSGIGSEEDFKMDKFSMSADQHSLDHALAVTT